MEAKIVFIDTGLKESLAELEKADPRLYKGLNNLI